MSQTRQRTDAERYAKVAHNAAILALVACPILAILPPRKLDVYTFGLIGLTGYSADYLVRESSGRSVWQHVSRQPTHQSASRQVEQVDGVRQQSVVAELQKQDRVREAWKVQREKEIQEDVEEGKGFTDMIMDQIWEVWNQGKTKDEDSDG